MLKDKIQYDRWEHGWWFRIYGYGLSCLYRSAKPLFSERNGYRKYYPKYPARWRFRILKLGEL